MIRNKTELLSLTGAWVNEAKNDLRRQALEFMRVTETSESELADMLSISDGELEQILRGNCEISLSTFAKILIATDHMVEVKPLHATPFRREGNGFGFPCPNDVQNTERTRCERQTPTPQQPRDARGRFMPWNTTVTQPLLNEEECSGDLEDMTRSELCDIIYDNGWENDINLNYASRADLIAFIEDKEAEEENNFDDAVEETETHDEFTEHATKLANALRDNPQLVDVLENILRCRR